MCEFPAYGAPLNVFPEGTECTDLGATKENCLSTLTKELAPVAAGCGRGRGRQAGPYRSTSFDTGTDPYSSGQALVT